MRILASILIFLTGGGLIAYSYVGALVELAGDVGQSVQSGNEASAFARIIDFVLSGEIPQITGYLYFGLLLIVISIVILIRKRRSHDQ